MESSDRFRQIEGACGVEVGKKQDEFLTAVSNRQVSGPTRMAFHRVGDVTQTLVAGFMAERIVVVLEVIHVGHDEGQRNALPEAAVPFAVERLVEFPPVCKTRKRVDSCHEQVRGVSPDERGREKEERDQERERDRPFAEGSIRQHSTDPEKIVHRHEVRDYPSEGEIAGIRDAFAPEIEGKGDRKDGVDDEQEEGDEGCQRVGEQGKQNERNAQVLENRHDQVEGFGVVLQGKEYPEELRSGEIESADDQEIQDIVDSEQLIRHEKAHETAPHHRMQAEEDAVEGEPETGSFGQTGADGDEIDQHHREEAEQDSVHCIIPNRFQRKGPIGENPDGKGHPGR